VAFQLLIAGEGRLQGKLQDLAASLGVAEQVRFLGFVNDMPAFMATIDIFVLSSQYEGFGYVLVEAMAAKRPVITFDDSSGPEIVADRSTGILVPRDDLKEFVHQIMRLAANPDLMASYGQAGRHRVEANFTIQRSLENLEAII
jgi:glycosyltransferase involved in cell wall biosynthesis